MSFPLSVLSDLVVAQLAFGQAAAEAWRVALTAVLTLPMVTFPVPETTVDDLMNRHMSVCVISPA
jgi:hypothetical protein